MVADRRVSQLLVWMAAALIPVQSMAWDTCACASSAAHGVGAQRVSTAGGHAGKLRACCRGRASCRCCCCKVLRGGGATAAVTGGCSCGQLTGVDVATLPAGTAATFKPLLADENVLSAVAAPAISAQAGLFSTARDFFIHAAALTIPLQRCETLCRFIL